MRFQSGIPRRTIDNVGSWFMSWDVSVSKVTGCGLEYQDSIPVRSRDRDFPLRHRAQAGSGHTHPLIQ